MSIIYRIQFVAVMNAVVLLFSILANFFVSGFDFWMSSMLPVLVFSVIAWFAAPLGYRLLDGKSGAGRRRRP